MKPRLLLEIVKPRRIVDEDFAKQRGIADPAVKALERRPIVDRIERLDFVRLAGPKTWTWQSHAPGGIFKS
jgi:hypothetical protein